MADLVRVFLILAGITAFGAVLLHGSFRLGGLLTFAEKAAVSYGAGLGLLSLVMFAMTTAGVPLTSGTLLGAALTFGLAAWWGWKKVDPTADAELPARPDESWNLVERVLLGVLSLEIVTFVLEATAYPLNIWDSWAIWGFKAKACYLDHGMRPSLFTQELYRYTHADYPWLLPLSECAVYLWLGKVEDRAILLLYPLFFAATLVLFYGFARTFMSRAVALAMTICLGSIPALWDPSEFGIAEMPLLYYFSAGILLLARWFTSRHWTFLLLSAVSLGLGGFTKNEGLALLAAVTAGVTVHWISHRKDRLRETGWPLLFACLFAWTLNAPWLVFRALHHLGTDLFMGFHPGVLMDGLSSRLPVVLTSLLREVMRWHWMGLWLGFAVVTVLRPFQMWRQSWLYLCLLTYVLFVIGVYLIVQYDLMTAYYGLVDVRPNLEDHLRGALKRNLVPAGAAAILVLTQSLGEWMGCRRAGVRAGES